MLAELALKRWAERKPNIEAVAKNLERVDQVERDGVRALQMILNGVAREVEDVSVDIQEGRMKVDGWLGEVTENAYAAAEIFAESESILGDDEADEDDDDDLTIDADGVLDSRTADYLIDLSGLAGVELEPEAE